MPKEIGILKASFARVYAAKAAIANHFYQQLFTVRPEFRQMFSNDMQGHKEMFAGIIAHTMRALDSYPAYPEPFARIADKHRSLKLNPDDFRIAEQAMLGALQDCDAIQLSEAEFDAWAAAIHWLVEGFVERCCPLEPPDQTANRNTA